MASSHFDNGASEAVVLDASLVSRADKDLQAAQDYAIKNDKVSKFFKY